MTKARDLASSGVTLTSTTTTADAALARAGGTMTGDLAMGTNLVDGVDVSARDAVLTDTTTKATAALPKTGGAMTGAITTNSTFDGVDIATRDAVLSSTTTTATNALNNANNALPKEGGVMTGPITTNSTFDGVDVGVRDSVLTSTTTTANAALPKAGGAITGAVTGTTASFTRLDINATNIKLKGDLFANSDGAFDIGASGASRPRNLYLSNSITAADITTTGVGTFGSNVKAKGYFASEATNSTNKWLAYTYTDNTFRFNYNGAGSDEFIIDSDGQQTITAPAGDGNPAVKLNMSGGSAGFNWAHTDFQASLGNNCNLVNMFGISGTPRNAGYIGFKRIGALGATTNILTLGLHSVDNVLNINGNSNVGIGTSSPSTRLTILASSANGIDLAQDPDNGANSGRLFFTTSGGTNSIRSTSGALQFSTGATAGSSSGTERMRLNTSGLSINRGDGTILGYGSLSVDVNSTSADGVYVRNASGGGNLDLVTLGSSYNSHGVSATDTWLYSSKDINIGGATGNSNNVQIVGNGAIRMGVSAAGLVTTPYQTAFRAKADTQNGLGTSWQKVLYSAGVTSRNGTGFTSYASSRFTAPVAGWYFFSASLTTTANADADGTMSLWINGSASNLVSSASFPSTSGHSYNPHVVSGAAYLAASDYVEVYRFSNVATSTRTSTAYGGWFSGFLTG